MVLSIRIPASKNCPINFFSIARGLATGRESVRIRTLSARTIETPIAEIKGARTPEFILLNLLYATISTNIERTPETNIENIKAVASISTSLKPVAGSEA
jgi:hypothetical protein